MAPDDLSGLVRKSDRHEWRLDALDKWRTEIDRRLAVVESDVLTERESRLLREALAANTAANSRGRFSRIELAAGSIVAAAALGSLILQAIGHA